MEKRSGASKVQPEVQLGMPRGAPRRRGARAAAQTGGGAHTGRRGWRVAEPRG
jgi:hypothetical protein